MIHIYKIPTKRSNGYCFQGPVPIIFENVDWIGEPEPSATRDDLEKWFRSKDWFTKAAPDTRFLVLCDRPDLTFQMVRA